MLDWMLLFECSQYSIAEKLCWKWDPGNLLSQCQENINIILSPHQQHPITLSRTGIITYLRSPSLYPVDSQHGLLLLFCRVGMTQGYQLDHSLSLRFRLLKPFFDNVLLEHGGLPHVLPLAVHLMFCAESVEGVMLNKFLFFDFSYLRPSLF